MPYVENLLSNYITWFQKIHGNQHYLLRMLENWTSALDQNETVFALFVAPWCSVITLNFIQLNPNSGFAQVYRYCSRLLGDLWWWKSLTMIPTGNKTCRLSSFNHHKSNSSSSSSSSSLLWISSLLNFPTIKFDFLK